MNLLPAAFWCLLIFHEKIIIISRDLHCCGCWTAGRLPKTGGGHAARHHDHQRTYGARDSCSPRCARDQRARAIVRTLGVVF